MDAPPIFRLPIELRYDIYDYLSINEPVCYPFPCSPITSISHGAPPRQLLLSCRKIHDEVRAHYYGRATFRFLAVGSSRHKRVDISIGTLTAIRQAKKVELMLVWNLSEQRISAGPQTWPWMMIRWVGEQAALLRDEGHKIELVTLSLRDTSTAGTWQMKEQLLKPLKMLKGKCRFDVGEIITVQMEDQEVRKHLEQYVKELNDT
jgi:hypothetical protein